MVKVLSWEEANKNIPKDALEEAQAMAQVELAKMRQAEADEARREDFDKEQRREQKHGQ